MHQDYQFVPASSSNLTLIGQDGVGRKGDYLAAIIIIPLNESPSQVHIKDGSDPQILVFINGVIGSPGFIAEKMPTYIPLGIFSNNGAWQVNTGVSSTVFAIGRFS